MLRHKWFKILIVLQIANFAAMALLEQQRRSIWNKEAANTQRIIDTKFFTEKTEENYRFLARLVEDIQARVNVIQSQAEKNANTAALLVDIQARVNAIQIDAGKNTSNAAMLADIQGRVNALQIEAGKNVGIGALIKDTRDRVLNLESALQKLRSDK